MLFDQHLAAEAVIFEREAGAGLLELLIKAGVFDGHRGLIGKRLEKVEILLGEEMACLPVVDVDGTGDALLDNERHAEDGEDVLSDDRLGFDEPLVGTGIGGHHRLTALDHFLDNRLRRTLRLSLTRFLDVAHHPGAEGAGDRIEQQDHAALGAEAADGEVEHAPENFLQVERGVDDLDDLVEAHDTGIGRLAGRLDTKEGATGPLEVVRGIEFLEDADSAAYGLGRLFRLVAQQPDIKEQPCQLVRRL